VEDAAPDVSVFSMDILDPRPSRPSIQTPVAVARSTPAAVLAEPEPEPRSPRRQWGPLVPLALLFLGLGVAAGRDLIVWYKQEPGKEQPDPEMLAALADTDPRIAVHFHDEVLPGQLSSGGIKPGTDPSERTRKVFVDPSMRFGVTMTREKDSK